MGEHTWPELESNFQPSHSCDPKHLTRVWMVPVRPLSLNQTAYSWLHARLQRTQEGSDSLLHPVRFSQSHIYVRWSLLWLNKWWCLSPIKLEAATPSLVFGGNQSLLTTCSAVLQRLMSLEGKLEDGEILDENLLRKEESEGQFCQCPWSVQHEHWLEPTGHLWRGRPRTVSSALGWKSLRWSAERNGRISPTSGMAQRNGSWE